MTTDTTATTRLTAVARACYWLAEANAAIESGNARKAEVCERKAQFWLDRLNKLEGK